MTATGQLIPLPVHSLACVRDNAHEAKGTVDFPKSRRPRIYRVPRPESWVSSGVYGADGRISYEGIAGKQINILA